MRHATVRAVGRALGALFGRPRLGNPTDPLDDLVYVMVSTMTTEPSYRRAYAALKSMFRTWADACDAPPSTLRRALAPAGLSARKARALRGVFIRLRQTFGSVTLSPLRTWETGAAEEFMISLPGVGVKTARCVLMYALGREVFPVDTHCLRVARRLGWTTARRLTRDAADRLQEVVPPALRYGLHVGMVLHGRETCTAANPKCNSCAVRLLCRGEGRALQRAATERRGGDSP